MAAMPTGCGLAEIAAAEIAEAFLLPGPLQKEVKLGLASVDRLFVSVSQPRSSQSSIHQPQNMTEVKLSETQTKAAQDAFKSFDKKNEDKIKVGDIEAAMKRLGHTIKPDWLEKIEHLIDSEGTGYIGFEEFCNIVRKKMQDDEDERELREMFRILDKEKRGEVNTNELRWILKNLGDDLTEADIDDMIADVDTDGSGWVDYNEFYKLMMSD